MTYSMHLAYRTFVKALFLTLFLSNLVSANETFYRNHEFATEQNLQDKFSSEIKPILDKRCVVCHSCSEAPCQLKLESIEGIKRGAHNKAARGSALFSRQGQRLFFDADSVSEWRDKGFYSVIDPVTYNRKEEYPIMLKALLKGHEEGLAAQGKAKISKDYGYQVEGMPYKLAPLNTQTELMPLVNWLTQGAQVPNEDAIETMRTSRYPDVVKKWEDFFNGTSVKERWTARYLYEHLFETHFYIDEAPGEFFEIVRSTTKSPDRIQAISSRHETDGPYGADTDLMNDPNKPFFYRLRKIHSTIVFKNHIIHHVNDAKLAGLKKLFLDSDWGPNVESYKLNYEHPNPFFAFRAIPAKIKYTWMLENAEMLMKVIMSGPNCRVNDAGSMIWDSYVAIYLKPEADVTVQYPDFFEKAAKDLLIPRFKGSKKRYFTQYKKEQARYAKTKLNHQKAFKPEGYTLSDIWTGNGQNKNSIISVFRHIDYASAHAGHFVSAPRTLHLLDYATFERLYYLCVVATTIRDSSVSQVPVVRYLFDLKKELEENFLSLVPEQVRDTYRAELVEKDGQKYDYDIAFALPYNSKNNGITKESVSLKENIYNILKAVFPTNLLGENSLLISERRDSDLITLERLHGTNAGQASHFPDITYIQVVYGNGVTKYFTLLVNRYHKFLNRIMTDSDSWDPKRDKFEVLNGIQIDFPYKIYSVPVGNLGQFVTDTMGVTSREDYEEFDKKYAIQKTNINFWNTVDNIHAYFHRTNPLGAGVLDFSKYGKYDSKPPSY